MAWGIKLVFLDGRLQQEGPHYRWINDRILFRDPISDNDPITVLYYSGERSQYGKQTRKIYEVLDPAQKFLGKK